MVESLGFSLAAFGKEPKRESRKVLAIHLNLIRIAPKSLAHGSLIEVMSSSRGSLSHDDGHCGRIFYPDLARPLASSPRLHRAWLAPPVLRTPPIWPRRRPEIASASRPPPPDLEGKWG